MANLMMIGRIVGHRLATLAGLVACGVLLMAVAGCGSTGGESRVVQTGEDTFQLDVLDSPQPVLVDFYKDGCPFCVALDPTMDQLSKEYEGRVKVCRFMIMTAYWTFPALDIKTKYQITLVPTVVLCDKGKEVQRWAVIYPAEAYRPELNKVAPPATAVPIAKQTSAPK
jgi:thioredoxin 1